MFVIIVFSFCDYYYSEYFCSLFCHCYYYYALLLLLLKLLLLLLLPAVGLSVKANKRISSSFHRMRNQNKVLNKRLNQLDV